LHASVNACMFLQSWLWYFSVLDQSETIYGIQNESAAIIYSADHVGHIYILEVSSILESLYMPYGRLVHVKCCMRLVNVILTGFLMTVNFIHLTSWPSDN
jgi:hypothetical protein